MADPSPLDLLVAGLLSHGFKELSPEEAGAGYRRFQHHGREDRWVRERDCQIIQADSLTDEDFLVMEEGSDYHRLLRKCGAIYIRTKERYAEAQLYQKNPKLRQKALPLPSPDDLLEGL